jgi:MFS family permease
MTPALLLGMAGFLTNFDVTAVVIALPAVARELGLDVAGYAWVMDAYSLAFTACLLFAGALADRYGRRRALLVGNGIFALASLACGIAWDGQTLLVARALQGIGAAFIVTGGFALIASVYVQARARTDAFALVGVMSGVAMAFGPTMGGLVSSWIGWRWIFLINLPACASRGAYRGWSRKRARQCLGRSTPWASYCLPPRLLRLWKHCCMAARRRHIWWRVSR